MKFELSRAARSDLETIGDRIALTSPRLARRFVADLSAKARQIAEFPYAHQRLEDQSDDALRRRIVGNYSIVYRVEGGRVSIARILHSARNIAELLVSGQI